MKTVQSRLHELLIKTQRHIATAESCTSGLISAACTSLAGSSEYMNGGIVTYTNRMKEKYLGVSGEWLASHGAVNERTAREMVVGAVKLFEADYGVATTGFAGPDGGNDENPVGTVYIAAGTEFLQQVRRFVFSGTREDVRTAATTEAIRLLYEMVEEMEEV